MENYVVFQIKDFILSRNNPIRYHKWLYLSLLPRSQNFSLTFLEGEVISPSFSRPAGPLANSTKKKKNKHQDIKQKEPPQKYRLGTISNTKLLAGLNRFYRILTSPSASAVEDVVWYLEDVVWYCSLMSSRY